MVERSLSMREVLGSMPRFSNLFDFVFATFFLSLHPFVSPFPHFTSFESQNDLPYLSFL
jgi:hypothetical protein